MRHRAVLFGLVGALVMAAVFVPSYQPIAFVAGLFSVLSFFVLVWTIGAYNEQIQRVVVADIVAVICLVVGALAYTVMRYRAASELPATDPVSKLWIQASGDRIA